MTDFDEARLREELSQEPIDETETRELLERLTAHDVGEHMLTLGAIAEATGHSVESVAAQLVQIRAEDDPALRRRVEILECVVDDHEDRLTAAPAPRTKTIVGPYGRDHFDLDSENVRQVVNFGLFVLCLILLGIAASAQCGASTEPRCLLEGKPIPCEMMRPSR